MLEGKDLAYRHGEDADLEAELALDGWIRKLRAGAPPRETGEQLIKTLRPADTRARITDCGVVDGVAG